MNREPILDDDLFEIEEHEETEEELEGEATVLEVKPQNERTVALSLLN